MCSKFGILELGSRGLEQGRGVQMSSFSAHVLISVHFSIKSKTTPRFHKEINGIYDHALLSNAEGLVAMNV
jgi:hypothetical protein